MITIKIELQGVKGKLCHGCRFLNAYNCDDIWCNLFNVALLKGFERHPDCLKNEIKKVSDTSAMLDAQVCQKCGVSFKDNHSVHMRDNRQTLCYTCFLTNIKKGD